MARDQADTFWDDLFSWARPCKDQLQAKNEESILVHVHPKFLSPFFGSLSEQSYFYG